MLRRLSWSLTLAVACGFGVARPGADTPVPTPESVLGFAPCADYTLARSEAIADYFRALDRASGRMQLVDIGPTTEGRRQILAVISSERNLRQLAHYKDIARALALNRDATGAPLADRQARRLSREGRAVVWVDFGLHSTEAAHAQAAPWFAWTMVAGESAEIREIRDNVILVLVPDMNPDGTTMVADWYAHQRGHPWELSLPWLYQRYAGHDNNRDWFMFTQQESRNVARQLYGEFLPQIVYDQHQSAPFPARIFVPPFADPANVNIPPAVLRGIDAIGTAISHRLDREGKSGVISRIDFDTWWNGGMRTAPYLHNMIGILTETGHASPAPAVYDPSTFPARFSDGRPTLEPSADYPHPYRGGPWTFRQSCEYMLSASMAVLDIAARRREQWQYDVYEMARDAMRAGARETYVVSDDQWDAGAAVRLVNALRIGGVAVERATDPFEAQGRSYDAGTYLIRGSQPYLPYVRDLLNPQHYPDRRSRVDGAPEAPYDISGWTLNLQMGVAVDRVTDRIDVHTGAVTLAPVAKGAVAGLGRDAYAIDPRSNDGFIAVNRLLQDGATIARTPTPLEADARPWPAGAFLIDQDSTSRARMSDLAATLGVRVMAVDTKGIRTIPLKRPRVGVYGAWGGNTDEGWTRWVLEQYEFPYDTLRDAALRAGNLRASYDVILLPDATYAEMVAGVGQGALPDEYTGGMTERGVLNLKQFVIEGGTLVAQDSAAELPLRAFGLPLDSSLSGVSRSQFYVPGALLRIDVDNRQPLGWGLPREVAVFFADGAGFRPTGEPVPLDGNGRRGRGLAATTIVATYPDTDLLMSGWARGDRYLRGSAAVVDAQLGGGHVILLGFRAQHRGQSQATFKLLFNAIYR